MPTAPSPVSSGIPRTVPRAHVCFRLDAALPLDLSAERDVHDLWRRLSYRVVRDPGDLLAHSRRVLLCRRRRLRGCLVGALLDLDHATAGGGRALRQRLLEAVRPCLGPAEIARFEALLEGSPSGGEPSTPGRGRVLPALASRAWRGAPVAEAP